MVVNSVHGQGIDRPAEGVRVEALAPDGQIEAISLAAHSGFSLALQWHPEWQFEKNAFSRALFGAFGEASRRYAGNSR